LFHKNNENVAIGSGIFNYIATRPACYPLACQYFCPYVKNITHRERISQLVVKNSRWFQHENVKFCLPDSNFLQLAESLEGPNLPCNLSPANKNFCESHIKQEETIPYGLPHLHHKEHV
jgi:hypothetical protein